jgi:hypothetical protein
MADLIKYQGPWKGLNLDNPENSIGIDEAVRCDNFLLRGGEIRTAPRLNTFATNFIYKGEICRGIACFLDQNNLYHTTFVTDQSIYQLIPGIGAQKLGIVGRLPFAGAGTCSFAQLINQLFFVNYTSNLYMWDGKTNSVTVAYAGIGAKFVAELASCIILLNTVELVTDPVTLKVTTQYFQQRVRSSASGQTNPVTFEPVVGGLVSGAAYFDMLDCPDAITGFLAIGASGYILRSNGISQMTPQGSGLSPFIVNHMWASERGMGNIYATASAQYGAVGIIVSAEDVYTITPSGFQSITGPVRYALLRDLANATYAPLGTIIPQFSSGYVYLQYMLSISSGKDTIIWCFSVNENQWFRRVLTQKTVTTLPKYVFTS